MSEETLFSPTHRLETESKQYECNIVRHAGSLGAVFSCDF